MTVLKTYAHLYSDNLDKAIPPLAELTGRDPDVRIPLGEVEVAAIDDFLVFAGTAQAIAALRPATATVIVSSLDDVTAVLAAHGGEITDGPQDGPAGPYLYARHADGVQVEYLQLTPRLAARILGHEVSPSLSRWVLAAGEMPVQRGRADAGPPRYEGDVAVSIKELARVLKDGAPFSMAAWDTMDLNTLFSTAAPGAAAARPGRFSGPVPFGRALDALTTHTPGPCQWRQRVSPWCANGASGQGSPRAAGTIGTLRGGARCRQATSGFGEAGDGYVFPMSCRLFWGSK
jgi:hypothetical protein